MTVTDVLLNFRAALLAIVPAVEHVGIPWKRPDSYDEWDAIASTLFKSLVVEVLRWSLPGCSGDTFRVPLYDQLAPDYSDTSTVEVLHPELPSGRWLFHAFGTSNVPLDVVEIRPLLEDGRVLHEKLATCPVEDSQFRLRLLLEEGNVANLDHVAIPES